MFETESGGRNPSEYFIVTVTVQYLKPSERHLSQGDNFVEGSMKKRVDHVEVITEKFHHHCSSNVECLYHAKRSANSADGRICEELQQIDGDAVIHKEDKLLFYLPQINWLSLMVAIKVWKIVVVLKGRQHCLSKYIWHSTKLNANSFDNLAMKQSVIAVMKLCYRFHSIAFRFLCQMQKRRSSPMVSLNDCWHQTSEEAKLPQGNEPLGDETHVDKKTNESSYYLFGSIEDKKPHGEEGTTNEDLEENESPMVNQGEGVAKITSVVGVNWSQYLSLIEMWMHVHLSDFHTGPKDDQKSHADEGTYMSVKKYGGSDVEGAERDAAVLEGMLDTLSRQKCSLLCVCICWKKIHLHLPILATSEGGEGFVHIDETDIHSRLSAYLKSVTEKIFLPLNRSYHYCSIRVLLKDLPVHGFTIPSNHETED
ncbi:hypothetical protein EGR_07215 [Echinococcus granulosus]|uniref:Uncharacterized protein n=1 Tax=Echinococcus granulosus TaxID=6210 RepID=W6UA75_ECHGR|nr:hypothetical protein EGR_07215 [Echinococcus granulosus]EUB57945.1 hypothetical protein EGR_07215 [Echinococcus granulosus]